MTRPWWPTFWVRLSAGVSLLLMFGVFVGLVALLWTGDWRWLASGAVASLAGFALGAIVTGHRS